MLLILVSISCVVLNEISASWYDNGPTTEVPSTPIRLVGGRFPWEGRVEIESYGNWGTICDDMFDINDTKVVCRMLGYNDTGGSIAYYPSAYFGPGYGPILVDDLKCFGEEDDVLECNRTSWYQINCDHDEDVSVNCRADFLKVRLVDGIHHWEGRVELFVNGSWGTICDDSFGVEEAHVICGMLGFSKAGSIAYAGAHFGSGTGYIVYDNLQCHGTENNISDCPSNGFFQHNCGHHEDAGVACQGPGPSTHRYGSTTFKLVTVGRKGHIPIRLNTAGNKGLLMLKYNGRWGYICYASTAHLYIPNYNPACRSLGYTSASNVYQYYDSQPAIVTDFNCYNSYSSGIDDCYGRNLGGNNYCNYKLYIECAHLDSSTTEESFTNPFYLGKGNGSYTNVRLVNGNFNWEGRVEIYYNGAWGTICDDQFDTNEAKVICAMLGYSRHGSVTAYGNAAFGEGYGSIVLDNLNCYGYESDISQCLSNGWKRHNCRHDEDASVSCRYPKSGGKLNATVVGYEVTTSDVLGTHESTNAKHITVNCQHGSWYVKVHLSPLEQQYSDFKETDIYLGSHSCTGTRSGDFLIFNKDYTTCGTYKISSANGFIYTNTLVYAVHDSNQPYIVHEYRFRKNVECDLSKRESGENITNNIHGNLEQQTISGVGHFDVQLKFFSDSNFQHEFNGFPPPYMVGQNVYVKATTPIHDYNVKMRLSDCYTKPSKSASDSYIYYLIQNGCPAAPSAFITTKSTHETRFHFQDFEYAFHPDSMYVHCNATFCHSNDYSRDCEPRCNNRQRVGNINDDEPIEGVGPIGYAEDEATVVFQKGSEALNAENKPEVDNKGDQPLYVVGVVVVAVAMVAILVVTSINFRSKRRQNGQAKIV